MSERDWPRHYSCLQGLCRFDKGSRPYHVAVLVPYRDREWNVRPFLAYMHPMLARQCIEYQIFFITQVFRYLLYVHADTVLY